MARGSRASRAAATSVATAVAATLCLGVPLRARGGPPSAALESTARDVASTVRVPGGATIVVAAPRASDEPAPRGDERSLRIAALVAGKLGHARAHPLPARLAIARAVAGRAAALVYVQPAIALGELRLAADVYPTMANAWDRMRNPLPAPTGHAFAAASLDAEVRSFLQPLLLEQATVDRARHSEGDIIAAGCGDVDGDGGDELVLVSRTRVALGRVRAGAFVREKVVAWSDLSLRAPVPAREVLATAVVAAGAVDVGSTDRGAVALGADLASPRALAGEPTWGDTGLVCLVPQPAAGAFDGAPIDCTVVRDPKPAMAVPTPRYDAFAAASFANGRGGVSSLVATREPSGRLWLKRGGDVVVPEGSFGAQLVLVDLDEDGAPEVVTTAIGADESISIDTLDPAAPALRPRLHLPAPEPVRALAVCPPEQRGAPTLVAVFSGELWLVRAVAGAPPASTASR
jgi:hypothetical protein